MSDLSSSRRWVAEIRFGEQQEVAFRIGNRSIHQFWHLFSSQFRNVLLPPQRRPDGGTVAWSWREGVGDQPVGGAELADVRGRLAAANRVLAGNAAGPAENEADADTPNLETQLRTTVGEMVARLIAESDQALAGFVCRTESGPMIHSWGAASPAVPFRPDARNGDIIGNVLVDAKGLAGVAVVIENSQGAIVARTESDQVGYFRFPGVAPGPYRIKVVDRPDFPAGGLAMTMSRESVTGLEIRGGTSNRTTMTESPPVTAEAPLPQSRRRRPLAWLAIAAVLSVGIGVWWFHDRPSDPTRETGRPKGGRLASVQVAGGSLAASAAAGGTPAASAAAGGMSDADDGFSSLSAGMPPSGIRQTAPGKSVESGRGDRSRDVIRSADSTAVDRSRPAISPAIDPIHRPASPAMREPRAGMPPAGLATAAVRWPREDPPSDKASEASAESGENSDESSADGDDKAPAAAIKSRAAAKKPHAFSTEIPLGGEEPSPGPSASRDAQPSPAQKDSAAKANEKKMTKPRSTAKRTAGQASGPAGRGEESSGVADSPDTEDSGTIADGPERKTTGKRAAGTPAGNPSTDPTAAAPTDQPPSETASDPSAGADAPESQTSTSRSKSPKKPVKRSGGASTRSSSPNEVATSDDPETEAAATGAAASARAGPAAASSVRGSQPASASNSPSSPSADQSPPDEASAAATETPAPAAGTQAPARSKPARTNRAKKNKDDPDAAAEEPDDPPVDSASPASQPPNTVRVSAADDDGLVQRGQIGASAWKSQLVRDLILPTVPIRASENQTVDTLRTEMLQQQAERRPKSFRAPRTTGGFVLEFAFAGVEGNERPHWRDANGAEPVGAVVNGNRAEVSWAGSLPARAMNYILAYPDGREIARLKGASNQVPVLSTAAGGRSWFWVGVECAAGETAAQFDWQLRSGAPVPASWPQHDHWLGGRGTRLDLPLYPSATSQASYALTLVDRSTGWALTCDLTLR